MASEFDNSDLIILRQRLLPVMERASIGYFDSDIEISSANSPEVNELLMGVQVLLEVIREKSAEVERLSSELRESRTPMGLIDELIDRHGEPRL
jgi:hypothetical protein